MTVTSTPIGVISRPLQQLRTALADCTQFRTWVGAGDQAEALARIYYVDVPLPTAPADSLTSAQWAALRPFAIVDFEPRAGNEFSHAATSAGSWDFTQRGFLWAHLEAAFDAGDEANPDEAFVDFANTIGKILQRESTDAADFKGLLDLTGGAGYPAIRQVTVHGPYRADEDDRPSWGDYLAMDLEIAWGWGGR